MTATRMRLLEAGRWSVLLCLFSVPLNKPATNIFLFLALLGSLIGPQAFERLRTACKQPVVIGAAAWFGVLAVSALHSPDSATQWRALGHYKAFLYPILVASLLEDSAWRKRGLLAFGLSASILLLFSWIQIFGIDPFHKIEQVDAMRFTVLNDYTHEALVYMVLAALAAALAKSEPHRTFQRILWVIAVAAVANVVLLLQSRTAYLALAPILVYWVWIALAKRTIGWRSVVIGVLALTVIGSAVLLSPRMQERLTGQGAATSNGIRLELWKQTLPIIKAAPLLGHGLGQWQPEYQKQIKGYANYAGFIMGHPHQEALLIMAEEGIAGFAVLVLLLTLLGRYIRRLDPAQRDFYTCLLIIYVAAGLANCVLVDFSHRHLFIMLLACIPFAPKPGSAPAKQAVA